MIFHLHFTLIMTGYFAVGLLLGRYLMKHGGASELELGLVFLIHPLTMFLRPIVCARADRLQNHKKLLTISLLMNSLAYVPMVIIPCLLAYEPSLSKILTKHRCFWIFVFSHLIGSLAFCGVRSLGDALAVNYAKRIGVSFSYYRKWGSIGFGTAGYLIGFINQNWILPDYVPAMICNVVSLFILMILVYCSSDDKFIMVTDDSNGNMIAPTSQATNSQVIMSENGYRNENIKIARSKIDMMVKSGSSEKSFQRDHSNVNLDIVRSNESKKTVTLMQQVRIFKILVEYDIRIPLFLLVLFLGGIIGYATPNFVYTYMGLVCEERGYDAAYLSGLTMISYCVVETIMYEIIHALGPRLSHTIRLEITLATVAFHYYFYAFVLRHVSPYFFLVESLHGVEYGISLTSGVDLGYQFANEVGFLMPELIRRGIISENDDPEMVRKSLLATMNSIFTLTYEGAGAIVGTFMYSFILDSYTFETVWVVNAMFATCGFIIVIIAVSLGKCFKIKPKVLRLQQVVNPTTHFRA